MNRAADLGEHKIIQIILESLEEMPNIPIPFGDDVSAVEIQSGKLAILKTDMLVGKTDVPKGMSLTQAARKAVVMNISDLAAKGVKPLGLLASIGVPPNLNEKDIEQVGRGLNIGAREYGAYILGGDTNETTDLVIGCTVFGICEKKHIMLRSGAEPNDIVAVTGFFGKTAAGLRILLQRLSVSSGIRKALVDSVLMPRARLTEGLALGRTSAVTASIDSSDGLAWSLHEIARASQVGFIIEKIPIAEEASQFARIRKLDADELCFYGGEEYELVVTVKPALWKKASEKVPLIQIGHAIKEKTLTLKVAEKTIPIEVRGWEHFKTTISTSLREVR